MYIAINFKKVKDKTYRSVLLMESYWVKKSKKVRHRTITNLLKLSDEMIEEKRKLISGGKVIELKDIEHEQRERGLRRRQVP